MAADFTGLERAPRGWKPEASSQFLWAHKFQGHPGFRGRGLPWSPGRVWGLNPGCCPAVPAPT